MENSTPLDVQMYCLSSLCLDVTITVSATESEGGMVRVGCDGEGVGWCEVRVWDGEGWDGVGVRWCECEVVW